MDGFAFDMRMTTEMVGHVMATFTSELSPLPAIPPRRPSNEELASEFLAPLREVTAVELLCSFAPADHSSFQEQRQRQRAGLQTINQWIAILDSGGPLLLTWFQLNAPHRFEEAKDVWFKAMDRFERIEAVVAHFANIRNPRTASHQLGTPIPPPGVEALGQPWDIEVVYSWMAPSAQRDANKKATRAARFQAAARDTLEQHRATFERLARS